MFSKNVRSITNEVFLKNCSYIFTGKECVVMAGGCTTNCTVLNDIVLIRISDWGFSKVRELMQK